MFIIWGFHTFEKIMGYMKDAWHCDHCNNDCRFSITRYWKWFTLFWIPLIPCGKKYFVGCPVCKYGSVLKKDKAKELLEEIRREEAKFTQ